MEPHPLFSLLPDTLLLHWVPVPACLLGRLSIREQTPKWKFFKMCFVSLYPSKPCSCLG